jgi:hypothetical protein
MKVLTGGKQPVFLKNLRIEPNLWITCLQLLMEAQTTRAADGVALFLSIQLNYNTLVNFKIAALF